MHHVIASQKLQCNENLNRNSRVGAFIKTLPLSLRYHLVEINTESLENKVLYLSECERLQFSYNVLLITRVLGIQELEDLSLVLGDLHTSRLRSEGLQSNQFSDFVVVSQVDYGVGAFAHDLSDLIPVLHHISSSHCPERLVFQALRTLMSLNFHR